MYSCLLPCRNGVDVVVGLIPRSLTFSSLLFSFVFSCLLLHIFCIRFIITYTFFVHFYDYIDKD